MKKIVAVILLGAMLLCLVCIYLIGGMVGVYAWNLAVFIFAPLALLAALAQFLLLLVRLFKKKPIWANLIFGTCFLLLSWPLGILFGLIPLVYPDSADPDMGITIAMPVAQPVLFGGETFRSHAVWPSERYAYDILVTPYDSDSTVLEEYGIYNKEVVSPIAGTVIAMENDEVDIPPHSEMFQSALGNYLFLEIDATGTYLILAHFKQGSLAVAVGEHVEAGTYLGRVGNSGTTSEPHLHVQHQRNDPSTMLFPTCAQGLPIYFQE